MESVCDVNDEQPAEGAYQDENGVWLRQEAWYQEKIRQHFDNCRCKRFSVDDEGIFYQMAMYYALVV